MAITSVELEDVLVFKGTLNIDFCQGINVLIGANGTGKTTLLRSIYEDLVDNYSNRAFSGIGVSEAILKKQNTNDFVIGSSIGLVFNDNEITHITYIPEKDILEHSRGLLPFIEEKQTGFGKIYKNILLSAMDVPTNYQSELQQNIRNTIIDIIGGEVEYDNNSGEFITIRTDGKRIPFKYEASGFKKLGLLGLLVKSGRIRQDSILIWDEPENSLNPEYIPVLVDILIELSRNGVQIFLATHSELFAGYIDVKSKKDDSVMFYSLFKDGDLIKTESNRHFDLLHPNRLTEEPVTLYEKELDKVFSNE